MIRYTSIITLQLQHSYFSSAVPAAFNIRALPSTQKQLEAVGMIARQTGDGLTVMADASRPLPDAACFVFTLRFEDAGFFGYTQIPLSTGQQIFYTSNHKKGSGFLSKAESVGAKDLYQLCSSGLTVTPAAGQAPELKDSNGLTVQATTLPNGQYAYSGLKGAYSLKNGDTTQSLYANDELQPGKAFLVVMEFFLSELKPGKTAVYTLGWEARSLPWCYHIINNDGRQRGTISIQASGDSIVFAKQKPASKTEPAQRFLSAKTLKLQELSDYKFSLFEEQSNREQLCLLEALPLPDARQVEMAANGLISNIYVYI